MGCAFYMLTGICVFCIAGIIFSVVIVYCLDSLVR